MWHLKPNVRKLTPVFLNQLKKFMISEISKYDGSQYYIFIEVISY